MRGMWRLAIAREVVELHQFGDNGLFAALTDALRHAAMQMVFEDQHLQLLNGFAHGIGLAQDVHAILVVADHLADAVQVPLDVIEAFEHVLFIGFHSSLLCSPLPPGYGSTDSVAQASRERKGESEAIQRIWIMIPSRCKNDISTVSRYVHGVYCGRVTQRRTYQQTCNLP